MYSRVMKRVRVQIFFTLNDNLAVFDIYELQLEFYVSTNYLLRKKSRQIKGKSGFPYYLHLSVNNCKNHLLDF